MNIYNKLGKKVIKFVKKYWKWIAAILLAILCCAFDMKYAVQEITGVTAAILFGDLIFETNILISRRKKRAIKKLKDAEQVVKDTVQDIKDKT